jgi:hypothetical protein
MTAPEKPCEMVLTDLNILLFSRVSESEFKQFGQTREVSVRTSSLLVALVLALVAVRPAPAQRTVAFGGTKGPIVNVPVDTSHAIAPPSMPQQSRSLNPLRMLSNISLPSFLKRGSGAGNLPSSSSFPGAQKGPLYPVAPLMSKN